MRMPPGYMPARQGDIPAAACTSLGRGRSRRPLMPVLISLFGRLFSAFVMNLLYTHLVP